MDAQLLFDGLFAVLNLLIGFFLKVVWDSVRDLRNADNDLVDKVNKIEVVVAGQYITREKFEQSMENVALKLDRIYDRLDSKQDKRGSS